ncbi:MAG: AmmeMemoRadiSam system protein A [Desulfobacterales bacterium]|nr:AmmeMemoRadiSam system protein A [Desulfobacterales bacterium]
MAYQYTEEEGRQLLELARNTLAHRLGIDNGGVTDDSLDAPVFQEKRGVFVSLHERDNQALRGCIGSIVAHKPLAQGVVENAINAAFKDPRFSPLAPGEFDRVVMEISILTCPKEQPHAFGDEIFELVRPFVDGVIIKKEGRGATFLPQVWEQLPEPALFLSQLCMKAGLEQNAWKRRGLTLSTYQVQSFEEE